jgi:hypothetical protein
MNDQIIAAAIAAGMAAEKAKEAAANTEVIVAKADEVIDRIKNGGRKD